MFAANTDGNLESLLQELLKLVHEKTNRLRNRAARLLLKGGELRSGLAALPQVLTDATPHSDLRVATATITKVSVQGNGPIVIARGLPEFLE